MKQQGAQVEFRCNGKGGSRTGAACSDPVMCRGGVLACSAIRNPVRARSMDEVKGESKPCAHSRREAHVPGNRLNRKQSRKEMDGHVRRRSRCVVSFVWGHSTPAKTSR